VIDLGVLALVAAGALGAGPRRVAVESATGCPAAAEVEQRLAVLLPPAAAGEAPARATIVEEGGALRVRLVGADGALLAERALTIAASCADRANVVAVVIAAWDVAQRAEHVEDPTLPHAARPPAPPTTLAAVVPPPAPPAGPRLELSFAPAVTLADGAALPSGALAAALWGRRLGARAGLLGLGPHDDALGDGRARWSRVGVSLELGARARGRFGRLDGHAGVVAGAVVASGSGFDVDRATGGFAPAALAGLDWSYVFGRGFLGAGASASVWPTQRLVFDTTAHPLPRWQPSVGLLAGVVF